MVLRIANGQHPFEWKRLFYIAHHPGIRMFIVYYLQEMRSTSGLHTFRLYWLDLAVLLDYDWHFVEHFCSRISLDWGKLYFLLCIICNLCTCFLWDVVHQACLRSYNACSNMPWNITGISWMANEPSETLRSTCFMCGVYLFITTSTQPQRSRRVSEPEIRVISTWPIRGKSCLVAWAQISVNFVNENENGR